MKLESGRRLGSYEIVAPIGAGGMGEVYRARDSRIGREVAIKILPEAFSENADRLHRFEQEARAAGALNHPNLLTIHELGAEGAAPFIVSELLEGETLREILRTGATLSTRSGSSSDASAPSHGRALSRRKAIDYAAQIASGLAAAHEKGIVHRDLKPENIFVTHDGRVKILDFGLAKLLASFEEDIEQGETAHRGTSPGTVLGTTGYMSPEQVRGRDTDHRSDIFSFGAVLYEMLTGNRAFEGESSVETMNAILKDDPLDAPETSAKIPPALDRIVRHCLEKAPEQRFQSARDLVFDLQSLSETSAAGTFAQAARKRKLANLLPWAVALIAGALLGAATMKIHSSRASAALPTATTMTYSQVTNEGDALFPSLSPDGKFLVYTAGVNENQDIFLLRLGGRKPINLTPDCSQDDVEGTVSPDGDRIAFRSEREGGGIFIMGATGESVHRLTDFGFNPSWSPDGKKIVVATENVVNPGGRTTTSTLWIVDAATGEKRQLTTTDAVQPAWSPDGKWVACWNITEGGQRDLYVVNVSSGKSTRLTSDKAVDWNPQWSPDGSSLYFASDRGGSMNLWRMKFDSGRGIVTGNPESAMLPAIYVSHFAFSRDGRQIMYVSDSSSETIERAEIDPVTFTLRGSTTSVTQGLMSINRYELSPDGKELAYSTAGAREDLFTITTDGATLRQLTDDVDKDRAPSWSPDGKKLVWYSNRTGTYEMWTMNRDGSDMRAMTSGTKKSRWFPQYSPNGRYVLAQNERGSALADATKVPWDFVMIPSPGPDTTFAADSWSQDSGRLAGLERVPGKDRGANLAIYTLATRAYERIDVRSVIGDAEPDGVTWLPGGSALLVSTSSGSGFVVDLRTKNIRQILPPLKHGFRTRMIVSRDGRMLYYLASSPESEIWMAKQ